MASKRYTYWGAVAAAAAVAALRPARRGAARCRRCVFFHTAAAATATLADAATAAAAQTEEILNHCMNLNLMSPHSLSQKVTQYHFIVLVYYLPTY